MEPKIKKAYVDTGKVKFEFRHFPYIGEDSRRGALAANCAAEQSKFWPFHERLYAEQGRATLQTAALISHAEAVGLDKAAFSACLEEKSKALKVEADFKAARDQGITGTPTFLVNGEKVIGGRSYEQMVEIIEAALAKKK